MNIDLRSDGAKTMLKYAKLLTAISFSIALFVLFGCSAKTSKAEGVVVDLSGKGIPNVTVIASQFSPIKGFERLEASTRSDGTYQVSGLYPQNDYRLNLMHSDWTTDVKMDFDSPPAGETRILKPITVRAALGPLGVLLDPQTSRQYNIVFNGKVLDTHGNGLSQVTVTTQFKHGAIRGYAAPSAISDDNGDFVLSGLFPNTTYYVTVSHSKWTTPDTRAITTLYGQQQAACSLVIRNVRALDGLQIEPFSLVPRFTETGNRRILDSVSRLEWQIGPDRDMNYSAAENWLNQIRQDGWRFPTFDDFKTLDIGDTTDAHAGRYQPPEAFVKILGDKEVWLQGPNVPGNGNLKNFSTGIGRSGHVGPDDPSDRRAIAIRNVR